VETVWIDGKKVKAGKSAFMNIIEIDHLTKRFGGINAVEDISFFVKQGEIFGVIGPNGAGKTTSLTDNRILQA
jgi:ABC-type uncharacterized transport system ATPase subunit